MRTSDPDILAAGDAVETPHFLTGEPVLSMLAGPANREGRIAADTIAGRNSEYRGTQGTAVVKVFEMTAGGTGMTETELRAAGMDYRKVYTHHNGHAAYYPGTAPLFLKVLFAPEDGKLLGGQVLGWDGVDKRIDVLAVALRAGMTVYDLEHLELAYAPPYGSAKDPLNMVGFLGANLLRGDIDLCYPEEFPEVVDRVTILDTRTQAEYDAWHIPGAVLMPYTELRQRLDEVPRDKPVYTYCRSGFRSYIAYCVLKQNGFEDVKFLSGGMMTYHGYHRTPLEVGAGGMPMVAHAEDELAQRPGALEHVMRAGAPWVTHRSRWLWTCGPSTPRGSSLGRCHRAACGGWTSPANGCTASTRGRAATAPGAPPGQPGGVVLDARAESRSSPPRKGLAVLDRRTGRTELARAGRARQAGEPRQRRQGRQPGQGVGRHDGLRQAAAERCAVPGRG